MNRAIPLLLLLSLSATPLPAQLKTVPADAAAPAVSADAPSDRAAAGTVTAAPAAAAPAATRSIESSSPKGRQPVDLSAVARALAARSQTAASGMRKVGDICEVKHDKQDSLEGFGLVLDLGGLAGRRSSRAVVQETGSAETIKLSDLLKLLNEANQEDGDKPLVPQELWDAGRLNLVAVTAPVPPEGVRQGDRIDCLVREFDSTDLENGFLLATQLYTPGPKKQTPLAVAAGPVTVESSARGASGKVAGGCLLTDDLCDEFVRDGTITLVLAEEHADFLVAQDIANMVNSQIGLTADKPLAKALNRFNVEIIVPEAFSEDPVLLVTQILQLSTKIPAVEDEP